MGEATFGKYRLIAELGHGGMADVFLAVMAGPVGSGFTKLTVVKRLRQNLAEEPEFVEMLVDEARISARLNHPNVVQTNEVGSVGNQYFLSMEYLDGQPLHRIQHRAAQRAQRIVAEAATSPPPSTSGPTSLLTPTDPFPRECQYVVIIDALAGLHHAHELADYDGTSLQIVHRDVTPHNIFVTYEGQVKVVDFGIAKAAGRASETRQGVVKGKVRYMAPEQAIGQAVDRRADVFSVGVMLWEAATGRRLWKDKDDLEIVQALVGGTMQISPREIDPNVPAEIDRICQKALAYSTADRYATAEDFRLDLEQYLSEAGKLTIARRKLAAVVVDLFKDKRAEIKSVIEKQLAQLKAQSASSPNLEPVVLPVDSAQSGVSHTFPSRANGVSPSAGVHAVDEPSGSMSNASAALPAETKVSPARRMAFVALGAVVLGAIALLAVTRRGSTEADAKAAAATSMAQTTGGEVRVKILTTPPTAQVTIDRVPLATPSDAAMPRDRRDHIVRVEAPGFDPAVETVRFESDLTMNVVLTKPAPVASASAHSAGSASAATTGAARWWPPPPPQPTAGKPLANHDVPAPPGPPIAAPPVTPPPAGAGTAAHKLKPDIDNGDPWAGAGRPP